MAELANPRRRLVLTASILLASQSFHPAIAAERSKKRGEEHEVGAVEDLMREHGVLRRTLNVYSELASRLSTGKTDIGLPALADAAKLFHEFGEDYHEHMLEETYISRSAQGRRPE